jgi:PST family polysaccharide transporter
MSLVRTAFYSALGTGARLIAALVVIKLVAAYAGPEGVGKLGQFMGLMSVLAVLAGGGIGSAIVKYVAEFRDDPERVARFLAAALWYSLCATLFMGVVALIFARGLASWLLDDAGYAGLIRILALAQVGIALLNYILAVVNGFMDVRRLALIQVTGSVLGIALALWLAREWHLYGALLALVLGQVLWLVVAVPTWWTSPYFHRGMLRWRFDGEMVVRLARFSVMTLSSALLPPLVTLVVRNRLAGEFGWEQVGYWQAVTRVSDAYLLFLTAAINIYYLPKLASTRERGALMRELRQGFRIVVPVVAMLALAIYVLRGWITQLLFTDAFAPANPLYGPQLVGDVVKIASFILSYVMLAKAMTRLFVVSECVFAASYLALVFILTARFGVVGAMYAFAINYGAYLVFNIVVVRRYLGGL